MCPDRRAYGAAPAQRGQVRPRLVAAALTKLYFDGGCSPNPGPIRVAAVLRGRVYHHDGKGVGSSGEAEWQALLHALEVARAAGETDLLVLGDSASVIDQARGTARLLLEAPLHARFTSLVATFHRVAFRRIKRTQNLAGIALDQVRQGRREP